MSSNRDRVFQDTDFDGMLYDVHRKTRGLDLLEVYPALKNLESWANYDHQKISNPETFIMDKNMVFRYIIFCYDQQSPILIRFLSDPEKRKTTAASYAGFEYNNKGHFSIEVDALMKCRNNYVNGMIIEYIRQFNDPEYALLISGYENYWQTLQQIIEVGQESDNDKQNSWQIQKTKNELFAQAKKSAAELNEISTRLLRDDNKNLMKEFYSYLDLNERNKLGITPEELAGLT